MKIGYLGLSDDFIPGRNRWSWTEDIIETVHSTRVCSDLRFLSSAVFRTQLNRSVTAELSIFCWLCGFIDRVTEWQDELGTSDTVCEKWLVIGYYCTRTPHPLQSTSGIFTTTGEHIKYSERGRESERMGERLRLIDWHKEIKMPGIRAGQKGSREMRWVRGS